MYEKLDFNELRASGGLPSPKGIALKVMHLCQDENLCLSTLAQTIQGDPALAGRVIKIANYVNPNRSRPIASVTTDTLILIGIHAVRQVVLGLSLVGEYRNGRCKGFDYENFWAQSVAMASAAHAICSATRVAAPAEMFNCGLMSGVGQLALVTARPEAYCEMMSQLPNDSSAALHEAQMATFGMTQRDMMIFVLQDWGIPKLFTDALYYHEDPLSSGYAENSRPLRITYALQLASLLARTCVSAEAEDSLPDRIRSFRDLLQIEIEQLDAIAEQTRTEWHDWCSMLDVRRNHQPLSSPTFSAREKSPVVEESPPSDEAPSETLHATLPLRILVASANELQRNFLAKALGPAGHAVSVASDGQTALGMLEECRPQVLIADWLLPGIDGVTLCQSLRRHALGEQIYYILITPFEDERRKVDAYEAGADELLHSPLNPRLLTAQMLVAQRFARRLGDA
jgi:two-component system, cell cycle response regulator